MITTGPGSGEASVMAAAHELLGLREQIGHAHSELSTLLAAISALCDQKDGAPPPALLVATNGHLVEALLDAQAETANVVQALADVARSAELDDLTGLPNRALMLDRFGQAIAQARRTQSRVGVLFIDLDNFKTINDAHGHAAGDAVLQSVAAALTGVVRDADTVSRHGGDEFLVLLPDVVHADDVAAAADHVRFALRDMATLLPVSASVGASVFPDDGDDPVVLIERADRAMYRDKVRRIRVDGQNHSLVATPSVPTAAPSVDDDRSQLQEANAHLLEAALDAQQRQAAAESARRQQADFMAVLSHELRNPLAPIRNAASLLGSVSPEELPRLQALIERQVLRLVRLTSDLLDISRADTGKLHLEMGRVELSLVLRDAADAARSAVEGRRQQFDVDIAPDLCMQGDAIRLEQVFGNLLDNASKYTPAGGHVALHAHARADSVEITITDSGIGINSDVLTHVFEPFVQEAHAVEFDNSGLGIGLAVVRELVNAHGGCIGVTSAGTGQGSQFTVTLPRVFDA